MDTTSTGTGKSITITRTFNAPRDLVFKAWTDPALLALWWGPSGFTNPVCELDVRPGGALLIHMQGPDGAVYPMQGVFDDVTAPERLVFTATALASVDGPFLLEDTTTVTFAEQGGQTTVTVQAVVTRAVPEASGALDGMEEGWNQTLDSLGEYLTNSETTDPIA
jgi:uncharacterized protein YndB with AHSA1/START domain